MYPVSPTNLKFRLIRSANLHRLLQIKEHKLAHNSISNTKRILKATIFLLITSINYLQPLFFALPLNIHIQESMATPLNTTVETTHIYIKKYTI